MKSTRRPIAASCRFRVVVLLLSVAPAAGQNTRAISGTIIDDTGQAAAAAIPALSHNATASPPIEPRAYTVNTRLTRFPTMDFV
jgi:hypothetical protein